MDSSASNIFVLMRRANGLKMKGIPARQGKRAVSKSRAFAANYAANKPSLYVVV
jgi:hypothetical protein